MKRLYDIFGQNAAMFLRGFLISSFLFSSFACLSQCPDPVNENSAYYLKDISIEGSTNLNSFSFWYDDPLFSDGAIVSPGPYGKIKTGILDFSIPVHSFKGSIPAMRKDFLDLLKASEYPHIVVGIEKEEFNCIAAGIQSDSIELFITLAGTRRAIYTDYSTGFDAKNTLILHGKTRFFLTDFHLEPPEKVLGLVRVQNEVFIKFDIVISNMQLIANQSSK